MGHLLILMWIEVCYNQNTFIELEFSNFTILTKKISYKIFWEGKSKSSSDIRTHDLQIRSQCSNPFMLGNNFGKQNIYKIILDYTISIGNT